MEYASHSSEQTKGIAAQLAATLRGGETIALIGGLGAGKTTFAQGFCAALGVESTVTSPTFAIMNLYEVRRFEGAKVRRVAHLDLYRLKSAREIAALGLEEFLGQPDTVVLIEWPEAVDGVQWNANVTVRLSATGESDRSIDISYGNGGDDISSGSGEIAAG